MLHRIPLEAFRVFDASARLMNFSAAGRELGITQAAVSRRIRQLEQHLDAALFERRGRNLSLTPEGERLFVRVRGALEYLEEAIEPFRAAQPFRPVSLSASGSVSHLWLAPRLRRLAEVAPQLSVRLLTTDSMTALADEAHDLAILYSRGEHPRWALSELVREVLAPVAAPAYLTRKGLGGASLPVAEVAGLDLLDYERFNAHWVSLRTWLHDFGVGDVPAPRRMFSTYPLAIDAALAGEGVALGSLGLIGEHLAAGRLVTLCDERLETGYGYYLGLPRFREPGREAMTLYRHLRAGAGATR